MNSLTRNIMSAARRLWNAPLLDFVDRKFGLRERNDFVQDAGVTVPVPWKASTTQTGGTPVADYVAGAHGGAFKIAHDATSEAQTERVDFNDKLYFDITKKPVIDIRLKIVGSAGAVFATGTVLVAGLAAARNATLTSNACFGWFRVNAAARTILYESKDGTTTVAPTTTGVAYVENTYLRLRIDFSVLAAVQFYIDEVNVATVNMAAATGNLQPVVELQKTTGTGVPAVTIDYIEVVADR